MATTIAIAAKTAAETSADITVASGDVIQVWTSAKLQDSETVRIYRYDGVSVEQPVMEGPNTVVIGSLRGSLALIGPGTFRLKKSITAASVAVNYDS